MKKLAVAFALVLASLALVACGSSSDSSSSTGSETSSESTSSGEAEGKSAGSAAVVDFEADPGGGLAYTAKTATAKAGKVTIDFNNPQPVSHDVAIEDSGGKEIGGTELVTEGASTAIVDLKPGTYTFYCPFDSHKAQGMKGTLTVK